MLRHDTRHPVSHRWSMAVVRSFALRGGILLLLTIFVARVGPPWTSDSGDRQEFDDLYAIFKDEIRGQIAGNVYGAMGNRFQLDGKAYNYLLSALNAVDRLRAITATPPFGGKDASLQRQRDAARAAFAGVLENLSWPRYQARLEGERVDLAGPSSLRA
jgi:hypothetical protein